MNIDEEKLIVWMDQTDKKLAHLEANQMAIINGDFCDTNTVQKEPRIDDEDARDAVYSWASKLQIHQVKCKITIRGLGAVVTTFQACSLHSAPIIEFTSLYANVVHGGFYTIEELCGEEEAPEPKEPTFVDLDERIKEKGEE